LPGLPIQNFVGKLVFADVDVDLVGGEVRDIADGDDWAAAEELAVRVIVDTVNTGDDRCSRTDQYCCKEDCGCKFFLVNQSIT